MRWKVGPRLTLWSTDFHGSRASAWNMKPTPSTMPRTGAPLTRIAPPLGRSRPDTIDSIVDLPHPVGPTTAQNWPAPTDMVTSEIAVKTVPVGDRNRLVTDASS